jgi:uncharacterized protein (TIGR02265 family)
MVPDGTVLVPFRGDVDIERLASKVPPGYTIKGLFVAPNATIIGTDWPRIEHTLSAPPRNGKYLTFADYPLADFLRTSDVAARRKYPGVGTCEAHRRLARSTFETFSSSTLGKVALSLVSGPASLLTKYGEMYKRVLTGQLLEVTVVDKCTVDLEYTNYYMTKEAIFGVIEGCVMACQLEPKVTVRASGEWKFSARAEWTRW